MLVFILSKLVMPNKDLAGRFLPNLIEKLDLKHLARLGEHLGLQRYNAAVLSIFITYINGFTLYRQAIITSNV